MKSEKSLRLTIIKGMILLSLLSVSMVGSLWIFQEYRKASNSIDQLQNEYMAKRKEEIRNEVNHAIAYINYKRSSTEIELKSSIKTRVYEAHEIAMGIYNQYKGIKSDRDIQEIIREALRPLIFNDGRGYFFIYDMEGNNILLPFSPHLEGKNLWDHRDSRGFATIQETAKMIRKQEEGFLSWYWYKPGETGYMSEKIGFCKYFAPFDWWIGTGEYTEDFEQDIQKEVLEWINNIRYGKDGYIFVYHFLGTILAHNDKEYIGINGLLNMNDSYRSKVVREMIRTSWEPDGEYLVYNDIISPPSEPDKQKIAFARSVVDWQWAVGTAVNVDEIFKTIAVERKKLQRKMIKDITTVLLIFSISLAIVGFLIRYISTQTTEHLTVFTSFFNKASNQSIKIDEDDVFYSEFKLLAESANRMMDDREKAEQEVSRLRTYLENIIDSMPSILVGVDKEHRITQWNKQAEKISGIPFPEAEGRYISELIPRFADSHEMISRAISRKEIFHKNDFIPEKDGAPRRYEEIIIYPLISNETEGAVIRIDDVSKQHEMQIELSHSRRLDAIGQLAGGIAHDFNNMLAGIIGGADLLKRHVEGNKNAQSCVEMIMQSGKRAGDLTKKMLAFARKGNIESTAVSVKEALEEAVGILTHSLDKRICISISIQTENTLVIGDSSQIQNVFINLGINAGHAMPDGGKLDFIIKKVELDDPYCSQSPFEIEPGEYLKIDVSDTGVGIPDKDIHRIFEPFYTTREAGEGSGLGLAAVYGTVQQHRGAISVNSEPGKGTTFSIHLPIAARQKTEDRKEEVQQLSGTGKILIIDDEEVLRITASTILETLGYETVTAEDGEAGLELYKREYESIDLVLMDMIMPRMNGKDCFYAMKEVNPLVKVILTSGFSQENDVKDLKKNGLNGFLVKPYTMAELSRAIAEIYR